MDFVNSPVQLQQLPAVEALELQGLQPAYRKVLLIEWVLYTLLLLAIAVCIAGFVFSFAFTATALLLFAATGLSGMLYLFINRSFPLAGYALRDRDVVYRRGWLVQTLRVAPFNRIQNCTVRSGPLERKYRLSSLVVYTAGASDADIKIPGLTNEEADRMRQFILEQIHREDAGV